MQDCEVIIAGSCWWRGKLERGCGNQVFDYATIIPLLPPASYQASQIQPPPSEPIFPPSQPKIAKKPTFGEDKFDKPVLARSGSSKRMLDQEAKSMNRAGKSKLQSSGEDDSSYVLVIPNTPSTYVIYRDKSQSKPIWLANDLDDSALKRQPELNLELSLANSTEDTGSPLSARRNRPHSRHRDREEKDREKEKDKEKDKEKLDIFAPRKSPSFSNMSIFASPPAGPNPNPNPTPRRTRLSMSTNDPQTTLAMPAPVLPHSGGSVSSLALPSAQQNASSSNLSLGDTSKLRKKHVASSENLLEDSFECIPSIFNSYFYLLMQNRCSVYRHFATKTRQ